MMNNTTVLVTGGTGSFGHKFTEIVLEQFQPKKLIIFSRDELKQHEMRLLYPDTGDSPIRYFIGDVRDKDRLYRAFQGVDVVVHAAALKQVPACEYNPFEAVQTNVIGARNVIDAALDQGVKKVIGISTDKAVNPVNTYGATKLCAEKLFVNGNFYSYSGGPRFSCSRYGNVVNSRGSVVPIFKEQRNNGVLTITDARMTRFVITLKQGVEFVIKCIGEMSGGEIFVPKIPTMGIMDVANVIAPDCEISYIGIRPGEKLHEVLISEDEARYTLERDDMYVVQTPQASSHLDRYEQAKQLEDGFRYASDTNTQRIDGTALEALLQ